MKRGRPNIFDLPFPPDLVEALESYLTIWRPILARIENGSEVFLNRLGQAFRIYTVRNTLQGHIYSFTGRHWHPHIMRTIWATEWIKSGGDFMTAAIMLNDRLETVIKNYAHLRDENDAEKALAWVQGRVNGH
jgi:site-specific recombinase XerD